MSGQQQQPHPQPRQPGPASQLPEQHRDDEHRGDGDRDEDDARGRGRATSALPDPFSPSPSRSSSSASSARSSSSSEDSISPSASASQVRQREQLRSQQHPVDEEDEPKMSVESPPAVDALQPSPLHMLTLLGSQLLQHDQHRQHEEHPRELGLSGIEELFAGQDEEEEVEEDAVVQDEQITPEEVKGEAMEPSPTAAPRSKRETARSLLTAHLVKLFALPPTVTLANGTTTPLQVLALHSAHLFRAGTLLTGTLYLTTTHILFYAYLRPRAPGAVLHIGTLGVGRARGFGWADEAAAQVVSGKNVAAGGITIPSSPQEPGSDSVSTLQGHSRGSTGPVGAAARIGAFLRKPANALGRGGEGAGAAGGHDSAATPSPSDSVLFGTTPTAKTPFAGFEPLSAQPNPRLQAAHPQASRAGSLGPTTTTTTSSLGVGLGMSIGIGMGMGFRSRTAPRKRAHHFVLTPRSLSWYASERDPYFPVGQLDMRWIRAVHGPPAPPPSSSATIPSLGHQGSAPALEVDEGSRREDKAAAEWFIEYVIPPGPRGIGKRGQTGASSRKGRGKQGEEGEEADEQERQYTLLLRAPSAADAQAWCDAVRRAVLRAGGGVSGGGAGGSDAAPLASLDVRRDSVRVSIPLVRIVDVEGSVGASGSTVPMMAGMGMGMGMGTGDASPAPGYAERDRKGKGRGKARQLGDLPPGRDVEQEESEGRTFVIRVWDAADAGSKPPSTARSAALVGEGGEDVVPLDEYCFVDVQRQQELWHRLERALATLPASSDEGQAPAPQGTRETTRGQQVAEEGGASEELARTFTQQPPAFTYPPSSVARPTPSSSSSARIALPRALSGPAKRLATGLALTRPVASGLGAGASSLRDLIGHQAFGLMERVREVWSVPPGAVAPVSVPPGSGAAGSGSPGSQPASRSRSRSGSEGWVADGAGLDDDGGVEGEAGAGLGALEDEEDDEDDVGDAAVGAEADLADSMSFSIVDLSSTAAPDADGMDEIDDASGAGASASAQHRTSTEQYNLELFQRTFVLPLQVPAASHSLSLSDSDLLGGSRSPHSATSSSLDRSTSGSSSTPERLLHTFTTASLYRVLPLPGRLFVSERFLCFRSARGLASRVNAGLGGLASGAAGLAAAVTNLATQPGASATAAASAAARPLLAATGWGSSGGALGQGKSGGGAGPTSLPTAGSGAGGAATGGGRTLMMLPLTDVIGVASNRAYRYGHRGMVVMIRGHEEIFFEFSSANEQKLCISTIEHQLEVLHRSAAAERGTRLGPSAGNVVAERSDALILRDLGERLDWSLHSSAHSSLPNVGMMALHASDDLLDAPAQAARRLRGELGMTSPVTSPSSPRLARTALGPPARAGLGELSGGGRMRSRSISTMSAPGLRSVEADPDTDAPILGGGTRIKRRVAGDVSIAGTDSATTTTSTTTTTTSSDLLSVASKPKTSMHFTILTIGSRGDVQPYIALSKRLLAEGHRVRIATHGEFRAWIEGHDIEFHEIGGDPAELMRICVENGTFTLNFLVESMAKFRGWLDDLLVSSWEACQGTDIVVESPSVMAGIHIAEALQVPYFRAFTMPWTRTRTYPHAFAVPSGKAGGNYNYMTYVIFDQVFWRAAAGQINRWRRKTLGLRSTNLEEMAQHKVPFLYNFSPSLVPKPLDWYDWIHVTGFWFLDGPDNSKTKRWEPPAELVGFIQRAREVQRKVVYIGWGSIVLSNAEETHDIVVDAVRQAGVCAILSKGWSDRLPQKKTKQQQRDRSDLSTASEEDAEDVLRERIFEVDSVPHDWLFPQLDAACHHGGAGTLGASLRAGIPTIVKPHFADQFFWAQQVETLGVGRCIRGELSAAKLADAIIGSTRDERTVRRARELGERIRSEDGVGEAIKALYRDLDYARSLIKPCTGLDGRSGGKTYAPGARPRTAGGGGTASSRARPTPVSRAGAAAASASHAPPPAATATTTTMTTAMGQGRQSRETAREEPFANAMTTTSPPAPMTSTSKDDGFQHGGVGEDVKRDAAADDDGDGDGDGLSDEAWSVVSGSEEDR